MTRDLGKYLPNWLKDDAAAISFVLTIHQIVELWDDLIDRDKEPSARDINAVFYSALVTLPRNPFYQRNFTLLNPIVESAIFDWWAANEREARGDFHSAHSLRCAGLSVTIMCARIVGGVQWATTVSNELRSFNSDWSEYAAKHGVK